jgi:hypothetical protein
MAFETLAKSAKPNILILKIAMAPIEAYTWNRWENTALSRLEVDPRILGVAYKRYGRGAQFLSEFELGRAEMLRLTWELLNEADIVVTYNGQAFDIKRIQGELAREGFTPPRPFKQIDLFRQVKANFRFTSNELEYVSRALCLGGMVSHQDFALWVDCLNSDSTAWSALGRHAKCDVTLIENLYDRLRPWIKQHPAFGLYMANPGACTNCGNTALHEYHGLHRTPQQAYDRYRCAACKTWLRGNSSKLEPRSYRQAG